LDVEKTVNYWIDGSEYDLETAKSLIKEKRYPHALFFGHLAIEKLLKALVVKITKGHAPHTHSLIMLAKKTEIKISAQLMDSLAEITEFNMEARYPVESRDFYKKCTKEFTDNKFEEIRKAYRWFKKKL